MNPISNLSHHKLIVLCFLTVFIFLLSSCSSTKEDTQTTTTTTTTTNNNNNELDKVDAENTVSTGESEVEHSIYKDRAKLSLSPYIVSKKPLMLFLNMSMTSLVEAYGMPIAKFYDNGSYVFEYLDFYCYFDGPNYSDIEMMNQDEMIAFAFQFKLTYTIFDLSYGQAKSEIDYNENTNTTIVSPFKIELIWSTQNLLTGIIVSEEQIE